MNKSGEMSFPVIQLVLVGDPSLRTCRLRLYIHSSRVSQVGMSIEISDDDDDDNDDDDDDDRILFGINHRCIKSSNLSVSVRKVDIVKMKPLGF